MLLGPGVTGVQLWGFVGGWSPRPCQLKYDFAIFNAASIVHVSFLPTDPSFDPFPTILPMPGTIGSFANPTADTATEPFDLYIHGHASSCLMKLPGPEPAEDHPEGLPVCVATNLLDGIKVTSFGESTEFRVACFVDFIVSGFRGRLTFSTFLRVSSQLRSQMLKNRLGVTIPYSIYVVQWKGINLKISWC